VFDAVDEAQMATDQVTPEQARAKLAARMKRDAKNPEATQAMGQEYANFKSWMHGIRDMVKISKDKPKEPRPATAFERRAPILAANNRVRNEIEQHNRHLAVVDQNHVNVPMVAINKAASNEELLAISWYIQGFLAMQRDVGRSQFAQGARAIVLEMSGEERGDLVAMHNHVNNYLPSDLRWVADIAVDQTLMLSDDPMSFDELGHQLSRSQDERVRKGAVVGYFRALFQTIKHLQREYHVTKATRLIVARQR